MKAISIAALAFLATAQARNPGIGGSITAAGLANTKNVIAPFIYSHLENIAIPEIDVSGGKFTNLKINLPQPSLSDIQTLLDGTNNALNLKVDGATGTITADFSYTYLITVNGSANINIKKLGVDFDISAEQQPGTPSTEMAPKLKVVRANITLDPSDIDITLSGSLVAKVASLIIPIIKSSVIPQVVSGIQSTILDTINNTINPDLAKYGNEITIPYLAGVTFDYAQLGQGIFVQSDSSYAQATLNATFFDMNAPESYTEEPVAFPLRNPNGKSAQVYISEYTANTLLKSGFDTGNTLDINTLLYKYLKVVVTTDFMAQFVPQFTEIYGTGKAVQFSAKFANAPGTAKVTTEQASLTLDLEGTFMVGDSVAASGTLSGIDFAAFIQGVNGVLKGNISKSSLGTLTNFQTAMGITSDQFINSLQSSMNKYIAEANADLATGIEVTSILGVNVSQFEVNFSNGYLEGGIDASPTFFEGVQSLWGTYKEEVDRIRAGAYKTVKYSRAEVTSFLQ